MSDVLRKLYWSVRQLIMSRDVDMFLNEATGQPPHPQAKIRVARPDQEDVAARLAELRGHEAAEYRKRLRSGHILVYAAGEDDEPQAWVWATAPTKTHQDFPWEFGIRMRVDPGSGFLWDAFTVPAHRGRGLYTGVLSLSTEQCFLRGAKRVWGYVEVHHTVSRRGVTSANLVEKLRVHLQKIGPFCHVSRPGYHRTVRTSGVLNLNELTRV